jgi:hypothetical protein
VVTISAGGGVFPIWSRTRHELVYSTFDGRVMVAAYAVEGDALRADRPRPWPDAHVARGGELPRGDFALHPDGNPLALATPRATQPLATQNHVVFVLNVFDELRRIAPVTKR